MAGNYRNGNWRTFLFVQNPQAILKSQSFSVKADFSNQTMANECFDICFANYNPCLTGCGENSDCQYGCNQDFVNCQNDCPCFQNCPNSDDCGGFPNGCTSGFCQCKNQDMYPEHIACEDRILNHSIK